VNCYTLVTYLLTYLLTYYASAMHAVVVCLSVYMSVTRRYCVKTTGRIELVFGMEAPLYLFYIV